MDNNVERRGIYKFLLGARFILICNYGIAQGFHGGLVGGFTTSQVDGDEHDGFHRIGAYGGVFVSPKFSENSVVVPEFQLTFSQKGAASSDRSFKTTIGYVDATFLLHCMPHAAIKTFPERLSVNIGTNVSAKAYENIMFGDIQNKSNDFNRIDWQARAGIGFWSSPIQIEANVAYSIIPNSKRYYNYVLFFGLRTLLFNK